MFRHGGKKTLIIISRSFYQLKDCDYLRAVTSGRFNGLSVEGSGPRTFNRCIRRSTQSVTFRRTNALISTTRNRSIIVIYIIPCWRYRTLYFEPLKRFFVCIFFYFFFFQIHNAFVKYFGDNFYRTIKLCTGVDRKFKIQI